MRWFVYMLRDPSGAIRYVGQSSLDPPRRLAAHLHDAQARRSDGGWYYDNHRVHWLRALLRDGGRPTIHVLERGAGPGWAAAERRWIARLRVAGCDLVNGTEGGEGGAGRVITDVARARYRAANRGERNPNASTSEQIAAAIARDLRAARLPSGRLRRGSLYEVAERHGVTREVARAIAIGRSWRHLAE